VRVRFFTLCQAAAQLSDHPNYQLGCVLARGWKPIGIGFNQLKTHPRSKSWTIHAELKAILNSRNDLRGCVAYIGRWTSFGMALSKPCLNCQRLLAEVGIKVVYFTTPTGYQEMRL
jgi:deoxycytidylate deaminase